MTSTKEGGHMSNNKPQDVSMHCGSGTSEERRAGHYYELHLRISVHFQRPFGKLSIYWRMCKQSNFFTAVFMGHV